MLGVLALYVLLHSPLRTVIAELLGVRSEACYFCYLSMTVSQLADPLSAGVLILIALLAAWALADLFEGTAFEKPLVFGLSALGLVVVPAAIVGVVADGLGLSLLRPPLGPLLTAVPATLVVMGALKRGWRPHPLHLGAQRPARLPLLVEGMAVALLLLSAISSLTHPPTGYDALSYHAPLASFLWHDGNLGTFLDRTPGYWPLAQPGTAELWYGLLQVAGGERLADLGQLPFAVLGGAAIYAFARRLSLRAGAATLAAGSFAMMPMVVAQIGMQLNDVAAAALFMAAVALAIRPVTSWSLQQLTFVGLGLGLAVTTKLALLPGVAGLALSMAVVLILRRGRLAVDWAACARAAPLALTFGLVIAPWWGRNVVRYGNPIYPVALPLLGRGVSQLFAPDPSNGLAFVPTGKAWLVYPIVEPYSEQSGVGALFAVGAIPGFIAAARRSPRRRPIFVYALVGALTLLAWWVLNQHQPRFLIPIFGIGFAFLPWSLLAVPHRMRKYAAATLAMAASFSALVTVDQVLLPAMSQSNPSSRSEFYDNAWGVDPVVLSLPEKEGLVYNTGFALTTYPGYYPLLGPSRSRFVIPIDTDATTGKVVGLMRNTGVRYAYVTASRDNVQAIRNIYGGPQFELVHVSTIVRDSRNGTGPYMYREFDPARDTQDGNVIQRYLFRLR
jgi:hypothetical protein